MFEEIYRIGGLHLVSSSIPYLKGTYLKDFRDLEFTDSNGNLVRIECSLFRETDFNGELSFYDSKELMKLTSGSYMEDLNNIIGKKSWFLGYLCVSCKCYNDTYEYEFYREETASGKPYSRINISIKDNAFKVGNYYGFVG